MCKEPIALESTEHTIRYSPTSRLNFGKTQRFDWNTVVQDHGRVVEHDMPNLIGYYKLEKDATDRNLDRNDE
jgi:hypothetical protein